MPVTEANRLAVLEAAKEHWGRDVAITLLEMLPPAGWGDVATRQQLEALESGIDGRIDLFESRIDGKFDLLESRIETKITTGNRQVMQWAVGTMVAMTGIFATIVAVLR